MQKGRAQPAGGENLIKPALCIRKLWLTSKGYCGLKVFGINELQKFCKNMRIYWINEFEKGNLGMMARPRGNEWLEDEIKKLKWVDVEMVISLLEEHEEIELEIEKEEAICQKQSIEFVRFPIQDRGVPKDLNTFLQLLSKIDEGLKENKKITIHCRMGIGRTSLVAAGVLVKNGFSSDNVFEILSGKRTLNVPDTEAQINWIKSRENVIKQL